MSIHRRINSAFSLICVTFAAQTNAAGVATQIEEMSVTAKSVRDAMRGNVEAASIGTVLAQQIEHRPVQRPAELLETIPGMVVTQHSGEGKANQYYLRGFNLDHGTDFATYVEGVPVNNVSHGHGQGYTDLNFIIPELVDRLVYKKGPYHASEGDFSSAGASRIFYRNQLEAPTLKYTLGEDNYNRLLLAGGETLGEFDIMFAYERLANDGPWERTQNHEKDNVFLKLVHGDNANGLSLSALYYDSDWNASDQVPRRLVRAGVIGDFDTLDDSTGGATHRYQLAFNQWRTLTDATRITTNAYWVDYELDLTSNFTYFSGPVPEVSPVSGVAPQDISDQINQFDERHTMGGRLALEQDLHTRHELEMGLDLRYDDISDVGLGQSYRQRLYSVATRSSVEGLSYGVFASVHSNWTDWFATTLGVRYDRFEADADARVINDSTNSALLRANSGTADDDQLAPKLSLRFGPFANTELFFNYGEGFHSNDARGAVADTGLPLIAESQGYEFGLRSTPLDTLQLTVVWFDLELDSELVFVGDEGTTEPLDSTRREGIELGLIYQPVEWLVLDADYALSRARFKDTQVDGGEVLGNHVPDAVEDVLSLGATIAFNPGLFGGLQFRYIGPRDLTESGDIRSDTTSMLNANLGYDFAAGLSVNLEVLNLLDDEGKDITYWYESRTQDERSAGVAPVEDFHIHPSIPRTLRLSLAYTF